MKARAFLFIMVFCFGCLHAQEKSQIASKSFGTQSARKNPTLKKKFVSIRSRASIQKNALYLYDLGLKNCLNGRHSSAIRNFTEAYCDDPLSDIGFYSMVMEAYCLYKQGKYFSAFNACSDIEDMRSDKYADDNFVYIKFLKILCNVESYVCPSRCIDSTVQAMQQCKIFLEENSSTKYADYIKKDCLPILERRILAKEMYVGRHYLTNNNFPGALGRFLLVLGNKEDNLFRPEAYFRVLESYASLGLNNEVIDRFEKYRKDIISVSGEENEWYKKACLLVNKMKNHQ